MRVVRKNTIIHGCQMKQKHWLGESDLLNNRNEKKGWNYEIVFRVNSNVTNYSKNPAENKNILQKETVR